MATKITIICDICKRKILPATQYSKINTRIYGDIRISDQLPDTETTEDVCMSCQKIIKSFIDELKLQLPKPFSVYDFTYNLPKWAKKLIRKKKQKKPNFGVKVNNIKFEPPNPNIIAPEFDLVSEAGKQPTNRKNKMKNCSIKFIIWLMWIPFMIALTVLGIFLIPVMKITRDKQNDIKIKGFIWEK